MPGAQFTHVDWLGLSVMVPGAHGVVVVEPVVHAEPAGHAVQLSACERPLWLEKLPARHGSSADAPGGQKLPWLHSLQRVAPLAAWNSPPLHGLHSCWPAVGVMVPGAHGVGVVEPVVHAEPAGQIVHSEASPRPCWFE